MKANTFSTAHEVLLHDPRLAPLLGRYSAPLLEKRKDPFHSLVRSIIYQQVSGKAAGSILTKYLLLFPDASPQKPPTPAAVMATPFEVLRSAGLSNQKALYIQDAARRFFDGTVVPTKMSRMTNDEVVAHLVQIKGVGVWTAQMFLMSTMRRPDVLPTGDLGIKKGFQIVYGLRALPSHKKMEQLARPWRAHATVVCHYLWRAADEAKAKPQKKLVSKKPMR